VRGLKCVVWVQTVWCGLRRVNEGSRHVVGGSNVWLVVETHGWGPTGDPDDLRKKKKHKKSVKHAYEWYACSI
jgi:hypothetical protein